MYNITFDASGLLLNLTDVNEGENKAHGFSVYNLVSGLDYIWPLYKLPSGRTVAGAKITLESANYTNNSFHVDFPNCLLTEFGRVLVQIVATNSTADSIDEIFDAYAAGTFTGKIVKSRLYDFYANESIDALLEMASASGGISQAVKDYLDNLGAICYRRILPSDSGIDGKISNVLENAVFYCNSTDRVFTDPPTSNAYTLINTQRSTNYNLQLAFGTTAEAPYIFWRIVNRNRDAADHDAAWITISGGGGGSVIIDPTLNISGAAADSAAAGQALALKADEADLADVAFSGDYDDLENKPVIPEIPTTSLYSDTPTLQGVSTQILYDSSSQRITTYADTTLTEASDDFVDAISGQTELRLDIYPLTKATVYDLDDGVTVVGYALTYNAAPMDYTNLKWRKIDNSKPIILLSVAVPSKHVELYSSIDQINLEVVRENTIAVKEELAEVSFTGDYDDLINKPTVFPRIPFGAATSTGSNPGEIVATIDGISSLIDGVSCWLQSTTLFGSNINTILLSLNVNGLGFKPIYMSCDHSTQATSDDFGIFVTGLFVYNSSLGTNGAWELYAGNVENRPTTDEMNTAIQNAIGNAIGGSY